MHEAVDDTPIYFLLFPLNEKDAELLSDDFTAADYPMNQPLLMKQGWRHMRDN